MNIKYFITNAKYKFIFSLVHELQLNIDRTNI